VSVDLVRVRNGHGRTFADASRTVAHLATFFVIGELVGLFGKGLTHSVMAPYSSATVFVGNAGVDHGYGEGLVAEKLAMGSSYHD
jgi:hypothetical protein